VPCAASFPHSHISTIDEQKGSGPCSPAGNRYEDQEPDPGVIRANRKYGLKVVWFERKVVGKNLFVGWQP
jgi:hypothetical protein